MLSKSAPARSEVSRRASVFTPHQSHQTVLDIPSRPRAPSKAGFRSARTWNGPVSTPASSESLLSRLLSTQPQHIGYSQKPISRSHSTTSALPPVPELVSSTTFPSYPVGPAVPNDNRPFPFQQLSLQSQSSSLSSFTNFEPSETHGSFSSCTSISSNAGEYHTQSCTWYKFSSRLSEAPSLHSAPSDIGGHTTMVTSQRQLLALPQPEFLQGIVRGSRVSDSLPTTEREFSDVARVATMPPSSTTSTHSQPIPIPAGQVRDHAD